jgi:hypothetical protein
MSAGSTLGPCVSRAPVISPSRHTISFNFLLPDRLGRACARQDFSAPLTLRFNLKTYKVGSASAEADERRTELPLCFACALAKPGWRKEVRWVRSTLVVIMPRSRARVRSHDQNQALGSPLAQAHWTVRDSCVTAVNKIHSTNDAISGVEGCTVT